MNAYRARIAWRRGGQAFTDSRYSRSHSWHFDGGVEVQASASPHIVPPPMADVAAVDPEEALVAAVSSCHMLWFLSLAAARGFRVDDYQDQASGVMARNAKGRVAMSVITLRPRTVFSGASLPSREQLDALHDKAHAECFIANSLRTEVRCEPELAYAQPEAATEQPHA